ncbi:hypothetical protein [Sphingomonas sp. Leaf230]|uniref:hypothetical protein n=1 Tax=Sphingomonas sp. Leaf230 TaxID=1735694 RepID=UPI0006F8B5FB|nr:hypothetical protein [Sphingomonas sp. Leaf230]
MTQPVKSDPVTLLALGNRMGLQGFATTEKLSVEVGDDQKRGAGAAAIAAAKQAGLKGFTVSAPAQSQPPRSEGTMALAVRLGLPGFVPKEAAATKGTPTSKPATVPPTIRVSQTPSAAASHTSTSRAAAPAPQMSKQRFVCVDIAAGGLDAFTALEGKMGQPFASNVRGQSSWLQRDNPDGGQTRAYPAMNTDLIKLEAMGSNLGSPALRMSVGPLPLSQFAMHTSAGPVKSGSQKSASGINPSVPGALRQALRR